MHHYALNPIDVWSRIEPSFYATFKDRLPWYWIDGQADLFRSILDVVPNADQSAALLALERMNPGKRVGEGPDQLP